MASGCIAVFCMPERGHLHRLLPLVEGLVARGRHTCVLTDARFQGEVESVGGRFVDLFERFPLDAADSTSRPVPSRYVSFAGFYADEVTALLASVDPALVVYDTFAVVAPVAALRLGVPYVNVCAGHAAVPARTVAALHRDPRVATSEQCRHAVERLRAELGMPHASPFSYVEALSPLLNLYCEPAAFLDPGDRASLEPLAFFGSLPAKAAALKPRPLDAIGGSRPTRVYVSFGTVAWRYFAAEATAALEVLAEGLAALDVEALVSLGAHELTSAARERIGRASVRVESYVDQWEVLARTDVFVTHHGLNSTHEAIVHEVPMLSYPFFSDQPALAARCSALGLAIPLASEPRAPLARDALSEALARLARERAVFAERLTVAHRWELETIAARAAVFDRLLALADG